MKQRELERLIGAVILPVVRPPGGSAPGAPARRPSAAYLERFPPVGVIGFGRRLPDGQTIDGLVDELTSLRRRALEPFFACCDLERGAGYHVPGLTALPPARALAEAEAVRPGALFEAGRLTGIEARRVGIELVLAPVLDVNSNPANPIIGARAFGVEPMAVADWSLEFLRGLDAAGVGASLKHFPGHGATAVDSHLELPSLPGSLAELEALELLPFRRVMGAGVMGAGLTVMVGHLDVPGLTGEPGLPTSLAPRAMAWLRGAGFEGAVLTDGLEMLSVVEAPELGVRCLAAGCDGLLGPRDEQAMAEDLLEAVGSGRLAVGDLERAAGNMRALGAALRDSAPRHDRALDGGLGRELAELALRAQPGYGDLQRLVAENPKGGLEVARVGPATEARDVAEATFLIWFGCPESRPAFVLDRPHLWAWSVGIAVEEALQHILESLGLPRALAPGVE